MQNHENTGLFFLIIALGKWCELPAIEGLSIACQYATNIGGVLYIVCGDIGDSYAVHPKKHNQMVGHTIPQKYVHYQNIDI